MSVQPIPEGYQTITPYITVQGAGAYIAFLKKAFQVEELEVSAGDGGVIFNAELRLGTSMLMVADARDQAVKGSTLYLYVKDPDKLYEQALAAGAKSVRPMGDQFYGDRVGGVEDAWGNQWWVAKRIKQVSAQEIADFKSKK